MYGPSEGSLWYRDLCESIHYALSARAKLAISGAKKRKSGIARVGQGIYDEHRAQDHILHGLARRWPSLSILHGQIRCIETSPSRLHIGSITAVCSTLSIRFVQQALL